MKHIGEECCGYGKGCKGHDLELLSHNCTDHIELTIDGDSRFLLTDEVFGKMLEMFEEFKT